MKEEKLPTRFFVYPSDKFSNDVISLNSEKRAIKATETSIKYGKKPVNVWEVDLDSLRLLRKNRVSIPGFHFKTYAEINDRIQSWQLLEFRKEARVAKVKKVLKEIGQKKLAKKRQPPVA